MVNGRKILTTPYTEITKENIGTIILTAWVNFLVNKGEIEYLYDYYKGLQPILGRTKSVRPEINNKVIENHAQEIVKFKAGYLLSKPIQYVARKESVDIEDMSLLNDFMVLTDKDALDKEIANWQSICGTAYKLVVPNKYYNNPRFDSPFNVYCIDPRLAFVIYSCGIDRRPMLGVIAHQEIIEKKPTWIYEAYSENNFFKMVNGNVEVKEHALGQIPLIEYPLNEERMGDFESVISLLDAINNVQSNRVDGVEQFIQSLMVFKNVDISDSDFLALKDLGAIKIKDNTDGDKKVETNVFYLNSELNQTQVQTLKDDLYDIVLKIVGMPQRNGGSSTSDTGTAVIYRDGWTDAESRASDTEAFFKSAEKKFLHLALNIARTMTKGQLDLSLADLDIKFTRRNYENMYQKVQALDLMLKNNMIAPRLAFNYCGLFSSPEEAYEESKIYHEEVANNESQGN